MCCRNNNTRERERERDRDRESRRAGEKDIERESYEATIMREEEAIRNV